MITVNSIDNNGSFKPEMIPETTFGSHFDGDKYYFFESDEEKEQFNQAMPFPLELYSIEINDYHNQMLDDVLKKYNYLSLGEVALWLNDVNYGAEAQSIIDWYKSSYDYIVSHIATITVYQDPTEFLLTIPKL
jgi:hypothetical protein